VQRVDDTRARAAHQLAVDAIASSPVTSRAGSVTTAPSTVTRPSATSASDARREATPAWARCFARRMAPLTLAPLVHAARRSTSSPRTTPTAASTGGSARISAAIALGARAVATDRR
jgi:hypothetical protein